MTDNYSAGNHLQKSAYHQIVERIRQKMARRGTSANQEQICPACGTIHADSQTVLCERCIHIQQIRQSPERYLKASGVPLKYLACTFDNFKVANGSETAFRFCQEYVLTDNVQIGILLYGPCGTGKTHLAVATLRNIISSGESGYFTSVQDILFRVRKAFQNGSGVTESEEHYLNEYVQYPILVMDDFGNEKVTEWSRQVIDYIVYGRDNIAKPIIVTTNLDLDQISKKIDARVASRLAGMSRIFHVTGQDWRRK